MLKTLIKRNGTTEDFSNSKANGWFIFAGKGIEDRIEWMSIVSKVVDNSPETMTTQDYQMRLIEGCISRGQQDDGWPYMIMAGRLYTIYLLKKIHGSDKYPALSVVLRSMYDKGLARAMDYTEEEYAYLDKEVINHEANLEMAYFQVEQFHSKYSLSDRVTKTTYETPQFTMMRMALAVAELVIDKPTRLNLVKFIYHHLLNDLVNPPTPNYSSLGTNHYGMASCCLIATGDSAESIAAAGLVAYMMTLASAGIGLHLNTRSAGDPVNNGRVEHGGRLNYIRKMIADTQANKQGSRGGAINIFGTVYDPEIEQMAKLQNPRTPISVQERRVNVTIQDNRFFAMKVGKGEKYFTFNSYTAPDLYNAMFQADQTLFEELYAKYEADPTFVKNYKDAYETAVMFLNQEQEVSTLFWNNPSEMNRHTPFLDTIWSSNLCMEVMVPTAPYPNVESLYGDGNPDNGETGICNIGSIPIHNFPFDINDEKVGYSKYKDAVRAQLEIIDYAIENGQYKFKSIGIQAKARRNASVGMSGVATLFASLGLTFNSPEGLRAWHTLCERHAFACIEVALEMGEAKGNAPWMHRTRWPTGWLPIDTAKKAVDKHVDATLRHDWEDLRSRVIRNGGIRFSSLVAHMPGEQATRKGTGSNSVYPLLRLSVEKADGTSSIPWAAKDNDLLGDKYQLAWELTRLEVIIHYAILQKFSDQGISLDEYEDRIANPVLDADVLVENYLHRHRYGLKGKYYSRSLTQQGEDQKDIMINFSDLQMQESQDEVLVFEPEASMCTIDGVCSN